MRAQTPRGQADAFGSPRRCLGILYFLVYILALGAILRNLLRIVDQLPAIYAVGIVSVS